MPPLAPLRFRSYAKINWYLDVLDKRSDGFNNIETIFQSVSLYDELHFDAADTLTLLCDDGALENDDNLVLRAARRLQQYTGTNRGVHIYLEKNIPVAAGLAGGSGNCAATLVALNEFWELNLDRPSLHALAGELGSDVPFCLEGGLMAATGRGEVLEALPPMSPRWLVLVHPPIAVKAGEVYQHPQLVRSHERPVDGKTPRFQDALAHIRGGYAAGVMLNRMENVVLSEYPELQRIPRKLLDLGAENALMSGSGPVFFALAPSELDAHRIAKGFTEFPAFVVQTIDHGIARL